ncbi:MAG: N-acetylmuramoyl-L-alanine amidase [Armatimonadetes bacterium]|nr:N-acetylmuramoyl-L-alanine amidase [Armatimonadota bacterium]
MGEPAVRTGVVRLGDECFVPFSAASQWNWKVSQSGSYAEVDFEGKSVLVPFRTFSNTPCFAMKAAAGKLGAVPMWFDDNSLHVLAHVDSVDAIHGVLQFKTSLKVKPVITTLDDPDRIVVDIPNAILDDTSSQAFDDTGRASQFKDDTVRVVLETPTAYRLPEGIDKATKQLEIDITKLSEADSNEPQSKPAAPAPITPKSDDEGSVGGIARKDDPASSKTPGAPPSPAPTNPAVNKNDGGLQAAYDKGRNTLITLEFLKAISSQPSVNRPSPDVLEIDLPGVEMALVKDELPKVPDLKEATADKSTLRLVFSRPVGVEVSTSGKELQIQVVRPDIGGGHLAGKVIVVDPGHGGRDTGARSPDGSLNEKDMTLKIASILSAKLTDQGATVIMTRKSDEFIPLPDRPGLANKNHADFFISVHINDTSVENQISGTTTYYHRRDPISQLMAECVQDEIKKVNGIPSLGIRSDTTLYTNGFAVLRGAEMPAVLIEMGFINNKVDRARMTEESFAYVVSNAIVRGLKVYLGDVKGN